MCRQHNTSAHSSKGPLFRLYVLPSVFQASPAVIAVRVPRVKHWPPGTPPGPDIKRPLSRPRAVFAHLPPSSALRSLSVRIMSANHRPKDGCKPVRHRLAGVLSKPPPAPHASRRRIVPPVGDHRHHAPSRCLLLPRRDRQPPPAPFPPRVCHAGCLANRCARHCATAASPAQSRARSAYNSGHAKCVAKPNHRGTPTGSPPRPRSPAPGLYMTAGCML